ncbi:rRNA pseudouridine synthase [Candidatus Woesearchaeota archaeon]|nr:rRNA pseudouridine synthase [Candidatus Woesearchaeota archaeon]
MRIQKIMSSAGVASRRKSEEMISQGRVTVNGSVALIGQSADPAKDVIAVDGKRISAERKVYLALNKPAGYVTTVSDPFAKRKLMDLVRVKERVFPVGRLDVDVEGLILLTNDGDFANRVMHPSHNIEKTYVAKLERALDQADVERIRKGVLIDGVRTWPAKVRVISPDRKSAELIIHEGRHKIVKRMFRSVGNYVKGLVRTRIGNLSLGKLERGKYRHLSMREVEEFYGLQ